MKVSQRALLAALGGFIAVAMASAGCSGGNADGSDSTSDLTEVKIGVGAPLTAGTTVSGLGMERAAKLAVAQANASETVKAAGLKFSVVSGDDQGDPKTGATIAETFASDASLVGVVGHYDSSVSVPVSKAYAAKKIVMVSPTVTDVLLTQQGLANAFRVCTTDLAQGSAAADFATSLLKFKTAYVVDDSTPYGTTVASGFAKQFAANGGSVLGSQKVSAKNTDFTSLIARIKAAKPDVIFYGGGYDLGALLAKQAKNGDVTASFMGGDGILDAQFVKLAGAGQAEGDFATSVGYPIESLPAGAAFRAEYKRTYPGVALAASDAYAYDATNVIIKAVLAAAKTVGAGKLTSQAGRDEILKNVAATNMQGVTGAVSFDAQGDAANKAITLYTVKSGEWETKALPQ